MICFRCRYCGGQQQVIDAAAGREVACRTCYKSLRVPDASADQEIDTAEVDVRIVQQLTGRGPHPAR